jgi:hypothetical protein
MRALARVKRKLLLGLAVVVVLGCATTAVVMAAQTSPAQPAARARAGRGARDGRGGANGTLAIAARYLGVSRSALREQLDSGKSLAQVADATAGKSASGLIDAIVSARRARLDAAAASLSTRVTAEVDRVRGRGFEPAAARYLGLRPAALRAELRSGETLAQIASSTPGKSEAGLTAALVGVAEQRLAAAVSSGKITQARASAARAQLAKRIAERIRRPHGLADRWAGRAHRPRAAG